MLALGGVLVLMVGAVSAALVVQWVDAIGRDPLAAEGELVPFTGGLLPESHAWNRYHVRYYPMAILFLAFDMEMVFMYPWAVVFVREGLTALIEMLMFIVILLLGVLYAWREGALKWQ